MGTRVTDSALYAQLWGTAELGEVFEERSRIRSWVQILVALTEVQAGLGIIPDRAARDLADAAARESLDLGLAARETRRAGHSTLGVIGALRRALPPGAAAWAHYGATAQDLTDTWMALAPSLGRHRAQAVLQAALGAGRRSGQSLAKVVESLPVDAGPKAGLLQAVAANGAGSAPGMVDEVVAKALAARAAEEDRWP